MFVTADLGSQNCIWIDLADFETIGLGMSVDGKNAYFEYAKLRLRKMGVPHVLVEVAQYTIHDVVNVREVAPLID